MSAAKKFDFTAYTYAPKWVLDRRRITKKHLLFYADNCKKLAKYMKALPVSQHKQSDWAHARTSSPECGTPACALGHAAYSNEFPGLQFGINGVNHSGEVQVIMPVINGGRVADSDDTEDGEPYNYGDWMRAGTYFFGSAVAFDVFGDGGLGKETVVRKLEFWAEEYEARAKNGIYHDREF